MTFEEMARKWLAEHMIHWVDANQIIEFAKIHTGMSAWVSRWGNDLGDYESAVHKVFLIVMKATTLDWLDQNKPDHFARSLFLPGQLP